MKRKSKIILASFTLVILLTANFASAALVNCGGSGTGESGVQDECTLPILINTIKGIINFLLSWAWLISVLFIVWSGFQMVLAAGNEEAVTKAKSTLTHAIVGFIIILLAYLIINAVIAVVSGGKITDANNFINTIHLVP